MTYKPEREIILDTETTGLDPNSGHRIIEIGALEMYNRVLTGNKFHFHINPERDVPLEAYKIHGISTEFLRDKPLFADIAEDFINFIEGTKLVIHNAPFDIKFLNHELSRVGIASLDMLNVIDTLPIARKKFPGAKVNLDALCKRFKIDNSSRTFHGALLDCELLAEVYVELTGGRQASFDLKAKNLEADIQLSNDGFDNNSAKNKVLGDGYRSNHNVQDASFSKKGNGIVIRPTEEEKENHRLFTEKIFS